MDSGFIKVAACAICLVFLPESRVSAQVATSACIAQLPASVFARVPVLLDTTPLDSTSDKILPAADILSQILTERIRKTLGPEDGALVEADSKVKWSELGGSVIVTAHHDGTFTWRKDTTSVESFMGSAELDRIVNALSEAAAAGERLFWPEGATEDSISYKLSFVSPLVRQDKKLEPVKVRVANPLFSIQMPWFKRADMSRVPRFDTPFTESMVSASPLAGRMLFVEFVVDSSGHVDRSTIAEVAPTFKIPPDVVGFYRSFRDSVLHGIPTGEFKPALVGGCPINQRVRQAFQFPGSKTS